jgi:flagellar protein FliO/FliZ
MNASGLLPLLWFLAILALIPVALWLLKRTPMGGSAATGVLRLVAQLPTGPNQRLMVVEVGQGDDRRWLVLGATGQQISTLHTLPPQPESPSNSAASFSQLLSKRMTKTEADDAV